MTDLTKRLSGVERSRLVALEAVVDRGIQTFVEVGSALLEIRSERLYRETHATFKAYCEERFGFSDSRGRQMIAAVKTVTDVTAAGLPAPRTEGEARRVALALRQSEPTGNVTTSRTAWNQAAVQRVHLALFGYLEGLNEPNVLQRALKGATAEDLVNWEAKATENISHLSKFRRAVRARREEDHHG